MSAEVLGSKSNPQEGLEEKTHDDFGNNLWENLGHDVPFVDEDVKETESTLARSREFITESPNRSCDFYLREIENMGRMPMVEDFVDNALRKEYKEFTADSPEFEEFTNRYAEVLDSALDFSTKTMIRNYSNRSYKVMNQVARGHWDYEVLGKQTPEALAHARKLNNEVSQIILSAPSPDIDFVTYRGTNLNAFRGYDVHSISDLKNLENQFYLESGFCSTSLLRDKCFTDNNYNADIYSDRNIEIKYLIPKDSQECIGLLAPDLSCYPEENEFLINSDSFSYVSKVEISSDQSHAQLEMVLIPRSVYDPVYEKE